ncbi:MAG: MMPL family transporter [Candidatus Latescibacteria bacterium]|nr:MMPL family transporter [Candidatus Latescibacterota bacterium]NIM21428.1 MMPL family transporter [Candidatus Latescibacterota bacterium]NIM65609.1 MMPL family transporter [Candidatus Latescibacterota bacterium]NIO01989.1 MMPL family transporter [Candidatus Latescibacterota bacterium]NIO28801.1 MMPL family transporter [Candidatus Latescibacterota bacterium]
MIRFFVRHPVTTWMVFAVFVVLGVYALPKLQIEAIPEIDLPTLTIYTIWNGASPQAVQRSITIPVEEAARKVHGIEKIESTSRSARSQVVVSFRRGVDLDFARIELNEHLGSVRRNLPLNAGQPQIRAYVPEEFRTEQFFSFGLESPLDPNELREMAETWVIPQLLALEGVADAFVYGGAAKLIKIVLDRQKLDLYKITPDEVFAALNRMDELLGAGVIQRDGLERLVALRDPVGLSRLSDAVVVQRGNRMFRLSMLGEVRPDFEDPSYLIRSNGQNVVMVSVEKRSGANTVGVSRTLRKVLPRLESDVPFEVKFNIDEDQGADLEQKLKELIYRSFVILTLLFLLLAVSLRQIRLTTIITGSIIFAIVISLSLFYFLRISVNFITISGLTVCFGLILDNSILVLDAIHRRLSALKRADDADLSRAAKLKVAIETVVDGTGEVLFPIIATTITTMVAFASFIFLSGRLALYYVPLAVSVATALAASLFVAFAWVPVILHDGWAVPLVRRSKDGPKDIRDPNALAAFVEDLPDLKSRPPRLERIFHWNQRLWWAILPLMVGLFIWGWTVYDSKVIKGGFWRLPDKEELFMYFEMPSGTDIKLTSETLMEFEEALMPVPEGATMRSQIFGNIAIIRVEFDDELLKTEKPLYFRTLLMDVADRTGGASIYIRGFSDTPYIKGAFAGSALNSLVKLTGYNSKKLKDIAETTLREIQKNRRVRNARITTGAQYERLLLEEVVITIHRDRLAAHGLSVLRVVSHLRRLLGVDTPWSMLIDGDHERIQLAFKDAEVLEFADAAQTLIQTDSGEYVRLANLISAEKNPISGSIVRENQKYSSHVNWEYIGTEQMRQAYIKRVIDGLDLPYGYEAEEARREFFSEEEEEELILTLGLALVFIFMVLAALFESITLPFLVLLSVPMALIGVFLAFWWTHSSFDSSARIGLILLFGIVVNNAILLISRFRTEATLILKARHGGDPASEAALFPGLRKQLGGSDLWKLPKDERSGLLRRAIGRATRIRLRSILLTSSTTMVGLAPLLVRFRETEDKDIWENLALASIGGLASSTILILLALPPVYFVCVRFNWLWRSLWQRIRHRA